MNRFIHDLDCSMEMVVARKIPQLFARKHNGNQAKSYADLLSHLLKNKLGMGSKLVLNIAARGPSTKNVNLDMLEAFLEFARSEQLRARVQRFAWRVE